MVQSVFISMTIYGCELYWMSLSQILLIQRVIDRAVRDILVSSSNYYQKAAYKELFLSYMALRWAKPVASVITK